MISLSDNIKYALLPHLYSINSSKNKKELIQSSIHTARIILHQLDFSEKEMHKILESFENELHS